MKTEKQIIEKRNELEATTNVVLVLAGIIPSKMWMDAIDELGHATSILGWVLENPEKENDYEEQNRIINDWLVNEDFSNELWGGVASDNMLSAAFSATISANIARMSLGDVLSEHDSGISA